MANEKRLIYTNAALEKLCEYCNCGCYEECDYRCSEFENISNIPAVDAVEVVRCKDCTHKRRTIEENGYGIFCSIWGRGWYRVEPDDFCSYGERGDGE